MLKRPFLCVAIAFAAGILALAYEINIFLLLTASLLLTVLVYIRGEKHRYLLFTLIAVFLLGILGMKMADYNKEKVIRRFEGKEMSITATVTEFSDDGKVIAEFKNSGKTYKIYLVTENKEELSPGDIVKTVVTPKRPFASKVSVSDFSTHLASKKVYLYGFASEVDVVGREKHGIMGMVYSIRRYVDKIGEETFSGDTRALFNAMVLGDKRLVSAELSASLRAAGLNHIAVVSGMHLSVMITVLMLLLGSIMGSGRRAKIILSIGAVIVTLITGAGLSAIRAAVMCIVCQGAFLTTRENDPLSGLSLTAFVMMAFNPFVIFDIGFVLSVLSVFGILLFSKPVGEVVSRCIKGKAGEIIAVSTGAQLTVTPVVMLFFGTVAPYAVLANLMVSFFVSGIVIAGMVFTAVAKIPLISKITVFVVKLCCKAVISACDFIQNLPGAQSDTMGVGWDFFIIWAYMLVIFGLKKKNLKYIPVITLCFAVALTGVFVYYSDSKRKIKMDFVPYGNHIMTVADCPDGPFMLLGCPDSYDAVTLAEAYGRRSYTYTVITRKKELSEAGKLASRGGAGRVIACNGMFSYENKQTFSDELKSYDTDVIFLENGEIFSDKDFSVRFYVFLVSDKFVAATDIEYKGKTFVSLQDFDAFGLDELMERGCFFQCDYLILPKNLPVGETYESLTTGRVVTDEKELAINLY